MTDSVDRESQRTRRTPRILQSLNWAFEGVIHVLRSARNRRPRSRSQLRFFSVSRLS